MVTTPAASPPLDEVTTALLDLFDGTGRTRADGQGFDGSYGGDPTNPPFPYWVLYAIPGGVADPIPTLDLRFDTVTAAWQVTAVSNLRNQAQHTARELTDRLLARSADGSDWLYPLVLPDGWQCIDRRPDPGLAGVTRTGETPDAIFSAPVRFTLTLTPV